MTYRTSIVVTRRTCRDSVQVNSHHPQILALPVITVRMGEGGDFSPFPEECGEHPISFPFIKKRVNIQLVDTSKQA